VSIQTIDPAVATWLAKIATALAEIGDVQMTWGTFYVSDVTISFDGEESSYRVRASDDGGFELVLGVS
jgi:hypothetical protein